MSYSGQLFTQHNTFPAQADLLLLLGNLARAYGAWPTRESADKGKGESQLSIAWHISYLWHLTVLSWLGEYVLHKNHSFVKVSSVLFLVISHLSTEQKLLRKRLEHY